MVLKIAAAVVSTVLPSRFYVHVALALIAVFSLHALAQGRKTTRERDLHARIILIIGAFTPLGLTLVHELAKRGAHVIAITPDSVTDERITTLVDLLRTTTANERIFAEECDLARPSSVRAFCTKFVTGNDTRIDAIVFAHEYAHVGSMWGGAQVRSEEKDAREVSAMATFLMITLLLPALLVAPVERDIRIIQVVNPFYAAGVPSFAPSPSAVEGSSFVLEGRRAVRGAVLAAHLQRVLDALPNRSQPPATAAGEQSVPVVPTGAQRSNIVSVSVSPGVSRSETVRRLIGADRGSHGYSYFGFAIYMLLQPILRIITKSPESAAQTVLHALFLPTPFKAATSAPAGEVLKPGALYAECAIVRVSLPELPLQPEGPDVKGKGKEQGESEEGRLPDDGQMGGVHLGQAVWEGYETGLKEWEQREPTSPAAMRAKEGSDPEVSHPRAAASAPAAPESR